MQPTITVTVAEGTFVFNGDRPDGSSSWSFLRKRADGSVRPGRPPRRFKRYLMKDQDHNDRQSQKTPRRS